LLLVPQLNEAVDAAQGLAESGVEVVLDGVVGAAGVQALTDDSPSVAQLVVQSVQVALLLEAPVVSGQGGVELVVVPALKGRHLSRHCLPVLPGNPWACICWAMRVHLLTPSPSYSRLRARSSCSDHPLL
jgi:hypothetical protein